MDKLAQLKDIHLPTSVGYFPLAWGWQVLIILAVIITLVLASWAWRYYWRTRAVKKALKLLENFKQVYANDGDGVIIAGHLSALLRRVALAYYPRSQVAGLKGQAWLDFLTKTSNSVDFESCKELLLVTPYQHTTDADLNPLFDMSQQWIKERGKKCSN